jgi:hypothetical protein
MQINVVCEGHTEHVEVCGLATAYSRSIAGLRVTTRGGQSELVEDCEIGKFYFFIES